MALVKVWDELCSESELEAFERDAFKIHENENWDEEGQIGSSVTKKGENRRIGKAKWLGPMGRGDFNEFDGVKDIAQKLFQGLTLEYSKEGLWERGVLLTNSHSLLLNYYDHGGEYKTHHDASTFTALFWHCSSPKQFTGGDIFFPDLDLTVPFRSNRLILFPGQLYHEVSRVDLPECARNSGLGRYCLSIFLFNTLI